MFYIMLLENCKIKATIRYCYTAIRMATIQNTDNANTDKYVKQFLCFVGKNTKWYNHFGKAKKKKQFGKNHQFVSFICKNKHILTTKIKPLWLCIGIYSKDLKTYRHIKTCMWTFVANYFNNLWSRINWDILH